MAGCAEFVRRQTAGRATGSENPEKYDRNGGVVGGGGGTPPPPGGPGARGPPGGPPPPPTTTPPPATRITPAIKSLWK